MFSFECTSFSTLRLCRYYKRLPLQYFIKCYGINSWLSLSRLRLSRITAYLEVKIWSLPKHENITTGKKILWKRGEIAQRSNFSSFPQYFQNISNFKSPITYIFVKCGCSKYFSLNSANLICRGTDVSKYFRESLGIRDNESRLYINFDNFTSKIVGCIGTAKRHL